ncbi:hypothetical protein [Nocardia huaxiensis]|uniref:hypothetical protein n=1 Tax=Nocardia huaxiensis TaxID=2755382 RepID=UPI001E5141D3|nr:hypothetical protein [Nocardia huaxiensis]UFS95429.1 hypothetical protein LPY97_32900 [Nocardia huaxiensis]
MVTVLAHATALAYLRSDISGARQPFDEARNRSIAKRLGYNLSRTVVFGAHTDDPIQRLINVARRIGAEAVIVPSLAHFGGTMPEQLVQIVDVITVEPAHTYARWSTGLLPDELRTR